MDYILELQKYFGCDDYDIMNARNAGVMPIPGLSAISYDTISETDELISACQTIGGVPICGFYSSKFDLANDLYMIIPYIPYHAYNGRTIEEKLKNAYQEITGTGEVYCLIADLDDPYSSYFEQYIYYGGDFIPFDDENEKMSSKLTAEFRRGRKIIFQKMGALDKLHEYVDDYAAMTAKGIIKGVFAYDLDSGYIEMIRDDEKCNDWPTPVPHCDEIA